MKAKFKRKFGCNHTGNWMGTLFPFLLPSPPFLGLSVPPITLLDSSGNQPHFCFNSFWSNMSLPISPVWLGGAPASQPSAGRWHFHISECAAPNTHSETHTSLPAVCLCSGCSGCVCVCAIHATLLEVPVCVCQLSQMLINPFSFCFVSLFPPFSVESLLSQKHGVQAPEAAEGRGATEPGEHLLHLAATPGGDESGRGLHLPLPGFSAGERRYGQDRRKKEFVIYCWVMEEWGFDLCLYLIVNSILIRVNAPDSIGADACVKLFWFSGLLQKKEEH